MTDLGKDLRKMYPHVSHNEVYARSTNVWRTEQSLSSLLGGFFGDVDPIHPDTIDYLSPPIRFCPRLVALERKVMNSDHEYLRFLERSYRIREKFDGIANGRLKALHYDDVTLPFDQVVTRTCSNQPFICKNGECLDEEYIEETQRLVNWQTQFMFRDVDGVMELSRLRMGAFVDELMRNIVNRIDGAGTKLYVYSAHDTSLSSLLGIFRNKDMEWPPFASNLIFELYSVSSDYFIRIIYNGSFLESPVCDFSACPFEKFRDYLLANKLMFADGLMEECEKIFQKCFAF